MSLTLNSQNNIVFPNIIYKKSDLKGYYLFKTCILTIGRLYNTIQIFSKACEFSSLLGREAKALLVASNKLPGKVINTPKHL